MLACCSRDASTELRRSYDGASKGLRRESREIYPPLRSLDCLGDARPFWRSAASCSTSVRPGWTSPRQFQAAQLASGVANVEPPVSQRGRSPANSTQHFGARQRLEFLRRRLPHQQFALLGEDDQLGPGQDSRAEARILARPLQLAGGHVDAAEVRVLLGLAVEGLEIIARQ